MRPSKNQSGIGDIVYFADSYGSWQKGCIENISKLIRQYVPKQTDFDTLTDKQILHVQYKINRIPIEKIGFYDTS